MDFLFDPVTLPLVAFLSVIALVALFSVVLGYSSGHRAAYDANKHWPKVPGYGTH